MKKKRPSEIYIEEGMILECDTLLWDDGWEFDHPSMMISPIIRCYETGCNHDQIIEDVMIDAVVNKHLESQDFREEWGWRGYKLRVLKRRFREALAGKVFPKAGYIAKRSKVRIVRGRKGELTWEAVE